MATEKVVQATIEDDEANEVLLLAAADMLRLLMVIGVHVSKTHQGRMKKQARMCGGGWSKAQTLLTTDANCGVSGQARPITEGWGQHGCQRDGSYTRNDG
jgi:hypothetical protein